MMIRLTKYFFIVLLLSSCEREVTVKIPEAAEELVVEGYIETGSSPQVVLSHTLPFFGEISSENFLSNTVTGATVIISDGTVTDTLYEPFTGIGYYTSDVINGENGKTYTLTIYAEGKTLTAVTAIPQPVTLDSVWFKVDGNRDSLGLAWAHMTEPDTLGNAYRWFARRINVYTYGDLAGRQKDSIFIPPTGGSVFEDKFINNRSFDFSFPRGSVRYSEKEDDENDERWYFKKGDTIVVKFASIIRSHFEFWRTQETQVGNNGNPFGSPAPVTSNIDGGLGIWGGYAVTYDTIYAQ